MRLKRQKLPFPSSGCAGGAHNKKEKEKEMEKEKEKGSSGPLPAGAAAAVGYMSVEDADALDCGACYHPLKPPIFQVHPKPYTRPTHCPGTQVLQLQPVHSGLV